jgi:hypothetical protein
VPLVHITKIDQSTVDGISSFATSANVLTFSGTLEQPLAAGQSIQISTDGGKTWDAVTTPSGPTWTYNNTDHPLSDGIYIVQARVADAAGNTVGGVAVQQVEVSANGTLSLSLQDVLSDADALTSAAGSAHQITIGNGGVVSTVHLTEGVGTGSNQWQDTGTTTVNGVTYDIYHNAGQGASTIADLLIQHGIVVG